VLLLPTAGNRKSQMLFEKAFEIDLNWRKGALEDEDLTPLWDSMWISCTAPK
jgi:hypothetical protein